MSQPAQVSADDVAECIDMDVEENFDDTMQKLRYDMMNKFYEYRTARSGNSKNSAKDARCTCCGKIFSNYKLDRLVAHSIQNCDKIDDDDRELLRETFKDYETKKIERDAAAIRKTISLPRTKRQQVERLIIDLIAAQSLPFSIIESEYFRRIISIVDPLYSLPKTKRFRTVLLPERAKQLYQSNLSKFFDAPNRSLTIELDGWTASNGTSYIAIVLTNKNGRSMLVDLIDISSHQHTASFLAETACQALVRAGVSAIKINAIVSDEASNYKLARSTMIERGKEYMLNIEHAIEYRCLAHVLNLIAATVAKSESVKQTFATLADLTRILSRCKLLASKLNEMGATKLIGAIPTRWHSASAAIKSALSIRGFLDNLPHTEELSASKWLPIKNDSRFWSSLENLEPIFSKLSDQIKMIEASDSTLARGIRAILDFGKFLETKLGTDQIYIDETVKAFEFHFQKLDLKLLFAAYILEPNYKLLYLKNQAIELGETFLLAMLLQDGFDESAAVPLRKEINHYKRITSQLTEPVDDVENWWSRSQLPNLKMLALRLNSCHSSSANTERIFSALNRIVTPSRNRISTSTLFELISIKIALDTERKNSSRTLANDQSEPQVLSEDLNPELSLTQLLDDDLDDDFEIEFEFRTQFLDLINYNARPLDNLPIDSGSTRGQTRSSFERAQEAMRNARLYNESQE